MSLIAAKSENVLMDKFEEHSYVINNIKHPTYIVPEGMMYRGHTLFEFNTKTMMIQPAEVVHNNVLFKNKRNYREYKRNPDCLYIPALNAQNAERRIKSRMKRK